MSRRPAPLLVIALATSACGDRPPATPAQPATGNASRTGAACERARLLPAPVDLAARGPWPVGVRTVHDDELTVEVWYPARPGSEREHSRERYDLRTVMPPNEAAKIPDADNAWLDCDCFRDLALDDNHGPYPVVVFLHGAASFRAQSAFLASHWASRGFVVVAPDLPGAGLAAALGDRSGGSPFGAPSRVLDLVLAPPDGDDPLAFVRPTLDHRIAVAGHSLGSMLAASLVDRPEIEVRIAMAGFAQPDGRASTLVLAGDHDGIASADGARAAIADAPPSTRLVVVRGAGHLAFSDLCTIGADRGGALAIARAHGVDVPALLASLATDGCRPSDAPFAQTAPAIRAATAGVLEERLRCDPGATSALAALGSRFDVEVVERLR